MRPFRRVLCLLFAACVLLGCLSAGGCHPRLPALSAVPGTGQAGAHQQDDRAAQAGLPSTGHVAQVVDGDTIRLTDGTVIRYIGVDTPEVRRREGTQWVSAPEPYGLEATEANRMLVADRTIRLEYDVETHDRYGRVLAYVYTDDGMVNAALIEQGYAAPMTIPPNVRHADMLRALGRAARAAKRGLWERAKD